MTCQPPLGKFPRAVEKLRSLVNRNATTVVLKRTLEASELLKTSEITASADREISSEALIPRSKKAARPESSRGLAGVEVV